MTRFSMGKGKLKYALLFGVLFMLFILARFPYEELERWAISEAGKRAGFDISMTGSSFLLPLGIELEGVSLVSMKEGRKLNIPKMEQVSLRVNLFSLFTKEKRARFGIVNGGRGEGTVLLREKGIEMQIDADQIDLAGFAFGKGILLEKGKIGMKGTFNAGRNPLEGEGDMNISGKEILLKGLHPFVPELVIGQLALKTEKKGERLQIKSLEGDIGGMGLKGKGTITLKKELPQSGLNLNAEIDLSRADSGPMAGAASMLGAFAGGEEKLTLSITGAVERPGVTINGTTVL